MLITNSNPTPWSSFWHSPMAYFYLPFHSENSGSQNINSFTYLFIPTVHIRLFWNHHTHTPMQSRPKKSTVFVRGGKFPLLVTCNQRQCSKVPGIIPGSPAWLVYSFEIWLDSSVSIWI